MSHHFRKLKEMLKFRSCSSTRAAHFLSHRTELKLGTAISAQRNFKRSKALCISQANEPFSTNKEHEPRHVTFYSDSVSQRLPTVSSDQCISSGTVLHQSLKDFVKTLLLTSRRKACLCSKHTSSDLANIGVFPSSTVLCQFQGSFLKFRFHLLLENLPLPIGAFLQHRRQWEETQVQPVLDLLQSNYNGSVDSIWIPSGLNNTSFAHHDAIHIYLSKSCQDGGTQALSSDDNRIDNCMKSLQFSASRNRGSQQKDSDQSRDMPSPEQLHKIREKLEHLVSTMFTSRHDYGILHNNVVLENNLFNENKRCVGVTAYAMELMKLRLRIHLQFPSTPLEIRNVHVVEKEGIVRIHWRLKGLSQTKLLKVWRLFQNQEALGEDDWDWLEAFSYFHIGRDGLVHKHKIDRMVPDTQSEPDKLTDKLKNMETPVKPAVG